MVAPVTVRGRDLRALAAIVSANRTDLPDGQEGLPPSLLADLMGQIRCDWISLERYDSERRKMRGLQRSPPLTNDNRKAIAQRPTRTQRAWSTGGPANATPGSAVIPNVPGDLRSVIKIVDFCSARQWHSTAM
jgi:hypothetical protein